MQSEKNNLDVIKNLLTSKMLSRLGKKPYVLIIKKEINSEGDLIVLRKV